MLCYNIFTRHDELCILVHVFHQVYWYNAASGREHLYLHHLSRTAWEAPILIPILAGKGISGATALGAAILIVGDKNYHELNSFINNDLAASFRALPFPFYFIIAMTYFGFYYCYISYYVLD
mgnify:CR=1 FL=1